MEILAAQLKGSTDGVDVGKWVAVAYQDDWYPGKLRRSVVLVTLNVLHCSLIEIV
jgi:hypothetical protein